MKTAVAAVLAVLLLPGCADDPGSPGESAAPVVDNVTANVESASGRVTITYDLSYGAEHPVTVTLRISDDGAETFLVPAGGAEGDVGAVTPGNGKRILWTPPTSPGPLIAKVIAVAATEVDLAEIVALVDSTRMLADLRFLEGARHYEGNPQHMENTKNYIRDAFGTGEVTLREQPFVHGRWEAENLIGRHPGLLQEEVVYIIDGHFDTVPGTPGVDDNASGTSGMLEAMRVLSRFRFEKSLKFIGFDLEEVGIVGSRHYVEDGIPEYEQTGGVFNFEMIGYTCHTPGCDAFRELGNYIANVSNPASGELRLLFDEMAAIHAPDLVVASVEADDDPNFRRSDHIHFWDAGIPALFFSDGANFRNPHYHRDTDRLDTIDLEFLTNVVRATVATAARLAGPVHAGFGVSNEFAP